MDYQLQSVAAGSTFVVNNNLVNSLRASYVRLGIDRIGNEWFNACDVGVRIYCGLDPPHRHMAMTISGAFNLSQNSRPNDGYLSETLDIGDDVSLTYGNHQFNFGAGLRTFPIS